MCVCFIHISLKISHIFLLMMAAFASCASIWKYYKHFLWCYWTSCPTSYRTECTTEHKHRQYVQKEDGATVTSPSGLWPAVLKPHIWHCGWSHLTFSEPEVTVFGPAAGTGEDARCYKWQWCQADSLQLLSLKTAMPYILHVSLIII